MYKYVLYVFYLQFKKENIFTIYIKILYTNIGYLFILNISILKMHGIDRLFMKVVTGRVFKK